ncbi:MAG: hypothetical protein CL878_02605 [Dehalococcoidia bacterium]|nr:hypothetical protein [Dehalococcoidia bacterium]
MSEGLHFRPRVPVVDANVALGHAHDQPSPAADAPALLAMLDRHGVQRAVVHHLYAQTMSAIEGNALLLAAIAGHEDRLIPQCSATPTNESLAQLRDLHTQGLLGSVRLYDLSEKSVPFADWVYGDLLAWLQEQHIPLCVPLPEVDAHQLVTTLRGYPELPVILVGTHYQHVLLVRPLLRALPQLHLELSRHETLGDVEALCTEFGAERLLYGSWYPRYEMGPILYYLHHTTLSETQLTEVCAGNAERLLAGESAP